MYKTELAYFFETYERLRSLGISRGLARGLAQLAAFGYGEWLTKQPAQPVRQAA